MSRRSRRVGAGGSLAALAAAAVLSCAHGSSGSGSVGLGLGLGFGLLGVNQANADSAGSPVCSNSFPGIEYDGVGCCPSECGVCETDCKSRRRQLTFGSADLSSSSDDCLGSGFGLRRILFGSADSPSVDSLDSVDLTNKSCGILKKRIPVRDSSSDSPDIGFDSLDGGVDSLDGGFGFGSSSSDSGDGVYETFCDCGADLGNSIDASVSASASGDSGDLLGDVFGDSAGDDNGDLGDFVDGFTRRRRLTGFGPLDSSGSSDDCCDCGLGRRLTFDSYDSFGISGSSDSADFGCACECECTCEPPVIPDLDCCLEDPCDETGSAPCKYEDDDDVTDCGCTECPCPPDDDGTDCGCVECPCPPDDDPNDDDGSPETCPDTDGIVGIQSSNGVACCLTSCGQCGGSGCSSLDGGGDGCCTNDIIENNELCVDKGEAPCLIVPQPDSPDTPDDDATDPFEICPSTDGIVGIESGNAQVCCLTSCGRCGGSGCASLDGGAEGCCTSDIIEEDELCEDKGRAPCLIFRDPNDDDDGTDCGCTECPCPPDDDGTDCGCTECPCPPDDDGPDVPETDDIPDDDAADDDGASPCIPGFVGGGGSSSSISGSSSDEFGGFEIPCPDDDGVGVPAPTPTTVDPPVAPAAPVAPPVAPTAPVAPPVAPTAPVAPPVAPTAPVAPPVSLVPPTSPPDTCPSTDGVVGVESSNGVACCLLSCGECGGSGCSGRDGGSDGCCTDPIIESGELCVDKKEAPCLIVPQPDSPDTPDDDATDPFETCPSTDGIVGIESGNSQVCCLTSCGQCGGSGCTSLDGGAEGCCTDDIIEEDELCEEKGRAPCLIFRDPDDDVADCGCTECPCPPDDDGTDCGCTECPCPPNDDGADGDDGILGDDLFGGGGGFVDGFGGGSSSSDDIFTRTRRYLRRQR